MTEEWVAPYRGAFDDGWEAFRGRAYERQLAEGIIPAGTALTERPPPQCSTSPCTATRDRP